MNTNEMSQTHTRFPLGEAQDSDVGTNGIQSYTISFNKHFRLDVQTHKDGSKYAEPVLEKSLDCEEKTEFDLILTAADGGIPQKTGTAQVRVVVPDINDNSPQFSRSVYTVQLVENSLRGPLVSKVEASNLDHGLNAEITYSFGQVPNEVRLFKLNQFTGEITVWELIDFEEAAMHELNIQATHSGGLCALQGPCEGYRCK